MYSQADILLLDDPLSAVDVHVGAYLFERCISGLTFFSTFVHLIRGLLKDRTRVLVTHQLQYVTQADEILVLNSGKVLHRGTYSELKRDGYDISQFLTKKSLSETKSELSFSQDGIAHPSGDSSTDAEQIEEEDKDKGNVNSIANVPLLTRRSCFLYI